MKRSRLLAAATSLAVLPARAFAQTPAPANVEVVAVNAPGAGNWLVYCAQHGNFFRDEGLQVGISNSGSPTTTINVVATNSANIGFDGTDVAVEAIAHQLPLKIRRPGVHPDAALRTAHDAGDRQLERPQGQDGDPRCER